MAADPWDREGILGGGPGCLLDAVIEAYLALGFDGRTVNLNRAAD
jgi:hypothetical protein